MKLQLTCGRWPEWPKQTVTATKKCDTIFSIYKDIDLSEKKKNGWGHQTLHNIGNIFPLTLFISTLLNIYFIPTDHARSLSVCLYLPLYHTHAHAHTESNQLRFVTRIDGAESVARPQNFVNIFLIKNCNTLIILFSCNLGTGFSQPKEFVL